VSQYRTPSQESRYRGTGAVLLLRSEYRSTGNAAGTQYRVSTGQYRVPGTTREARDSRVRLATRRFTKPRAREALTDSPLSRSGGSRAGIAAMAGECTRSRPRIAQTVARGVTKSRQMAEGAR